MADEKVFCCDGCKMVYELLSDNNLCTYYELEKTPGSQQPVSGSLSRFQFMDQEDVRPRFILFEDEKRAHASFRVPQMHCVSCIWLLENLQKLNPAILLSRVDFPKRTVTVSFLKNDIRLSEVVRLMARIGYEPELRMKHLLDQKMKRNPGSLGLKIGLAGFAFGNIMLFSLPEYFGSGRVPGALNTIFEGLNIVISLPVLFYSASGFFSSAYQGLKQRQVNMDLPISIGILALYGRSLYEVLAQVGPGYFDSFAALIFFLLIGRLVQQHSFTSLSFDRDYASFFPISVSRLRQPSHEESVVPITEVQVGDTLRLRNGELVPADAVLLSENCQIDYSFVTGEAVPVARLKGDLIYAGGRLTGGQADMVVSKAVSQSYLTALWNNPVFTKKERPDDFSAWNTGIAGYFTLAVMLIAVSGMFYWLPVDASKATHVLISVLIIACPCALAMSAPFTLGTTVNVLSRNGFFAKNSNVIERLASIRHLVFDKTGTLTQVNEGAAVLVSGSMDETQRQAVQSVFMQSTHPVSRAVSRWFNSSHSKAVNRFEEISGRGISGYVDERFVVAGSRGFLATQGIQVPERTQGTVYVGIDGRFIAAFVLESRVREGISALVEALKRQNLVLHLLSGDSTRDEGTMRALFGKETVLEFGKSPAEKLETLEKIRLSGPVAMIGDGLNDAGALKSSDVGIAVTDDIKGFTPASDAILSGYSMQKLADMIRFARSARTIVWISFGISFLYNLIGLSYAVSGLLSPLVSAILMPLSSLSVIGFTSTSTIISAWRKGLWSWKS